eukprot:TRINITY_DN15600_c0_g1_i1.p1 TRINITY_DN15600_c0_g1~~TRINITY_DN15600_c0_g1_i1.p1  ORF type:complete len:693 (+),score=178.89 TRINITY_DN15600_c0_g1_i1:66-2144(+)
MARAKRQSGGGGARRRTSGSVPPTAARGRGWPTRGGRGFAVPGRGGPPPPRPVPVLASQPQQQQQQRAPVPAARRSTAGRGAGGPQRAGYTLPTSPRFPPPAGRVAPAPAGRGPGPLPGWAWGAAPLPAGRAAPRSGTPRWFPAPQSRGPRRQIQPPNTRAPEGSPSPVPEVCGIGGVPDPIDDTEACSSQLCSPRALLLPPQSPEQAQGDDDGAQHAWDTLDEGPQEQALESDEAPQRLSQSPTPQPERQLSLSESEWEPLGPEEAGEAAPEKAVEAVPEEPGKGAPEEPHKAALQEPAEAVPEAEDMAFAELGEALERESARSDSPPPPQELPTAEDEALPQGLNQQASTEQASTEPVLASGGPEEGGPDEDCGPEEDCGILRVPLQPLPQYMLDNRVQPKIMKPKRWGRRGVLECPASPESQPLPQPQPQAQPQPQPPAQPQQAPAQEGEPRKGDQPPHVEEDDAVPCPRVETEAERRARAEAARLLEGAKRYVEQEEQRRRQQRAEAERRAQYERERKEAHRRTRHANEQLSKMQRRREREHRAREAARDLQELRAREAEEEQRRAAAERAERERERRAAEARARRREAAMLESQRLEASAEALTLLMHGSDPCGLAEELRLQGRRLAAMSDEELAEHYREKEEAEAAERAEAEQRAPQEQVLAKSAAEKRETDLELAAAKRRRTAEA